MNRFRRRVYIKPTPTDLRKGFKGLYGLVVNTPQADILRGDVFVFLNRRRTLVKTLLWDGTGFRLTIKILSRGRFADLFRLEEKKFIAVSNQGLEYLLSGAPLHRVFRPK